jgi:hypothetical protein
MGRRGKPVATLAGVNHQHLLTGAGQLKPRGQAGVAAASDNDVVFHERSPFFEGWGFLETS